MFQACRTLNVKKVEALLLEGTNPNMRRTCRWTPLHETILAVRESPYSKIRNRKILTIIKLLLKAGADIDAQDSLGMTPLMSSARYEELHFIMKALFRQGANPHIEDFLGRTFSHYITIN